MSQGFLDDRRQALENAFFAKKNMELLAQVRADLDTQEQRESLKAATGIDNDEVLSQMLDLGVEVESLTAMSIAPLVLVAWADGTMDTKERAAILDGARAAGIKEGSTAFQLLDGWLDEKPGDSLLQAWIAYTSGVCEHLQAGDVVVLHERVMGRCKKVAEAAGGFLGLGSISAKEHEMLKKLEAVFQAA